MTSNFDPTIFLQATTNEVNTRRPPIPGGTVLLGTIGEPKIRQTEGKKESVLGQTFTWLDLPITLDLTSNPALRDKQGQDSVTLTWSTRLDVTEQGGFDMSTGKNNGLRQLREALDMNKPGDTFGLSMVQGRPIRCSIKNDPYEGEVYDKIDKLSPRLKESVMFRFIITDSLNGEITGTDDFDDAKALATYGDFFVYDSQRGIWMQTEGGEETLTKINPLFIPDTEDEEQDEGEEESDED